MLVVPPGVVTLTLLAPRAAPAVMVTLAVTVVAVEPVMAALTPVPEKFTAVAPVRLVPVNVTDSVVPCVPVAGAIEVSVGATTVNAGLTRLVVPPGVVTLTPLVPRAAPAVMVKVAVTVVAVEPVTTALTPVPVKFTAVAPVRFVPLRVTMTVDAGRPVLGASVVSVGATTVNAGLRMFVVPAGVVTLAPLVPRPAPAVMVKVAVTVVAVEPVTTALTPVPVKFTVVAPARFVPLRVTTTVDAGRPVLGLSEVSVGVVDERTVNAPVRVLVVPAGVVTLTFLAPVAAVAVMVKVAVTVVAVEPVTTALTPAPEKFTAVAPVRPVPLRVTTTAVPCAPEVGASEVSVSVPGVTVNAPVRMLLVPEGVVTLTFLAPVAAVGPTVKEAVTVVAVEPVTTALTPVPEKFTVVAPVRFVPLRVTTTVVPCAPEVGASEVSVGVDGRTVNAPVRMLVVPPGVVTLTLLVPVAAVAVMLKVAVTVVAVEPVTTALTPVPEKFTVVAPVRPVPLSVTTTAVPCTPEVGASEVSVGNTTVNAPVTMLLVPPAVVTLTFLAPRAAPAVIVKVAVTVPAVDPVTTALTPVPEKFTADAPARFVPVRVTTTVEFRSPVFGLSEINVGTGIVPWNSTAPISNFVFGASGRLFPKKSVARVGYAAVLKFPPVVGM
jgi:hypothetical protein